MLLYSKITLKYRNRNYSLKPSALALVAAYRVDTKLFIFEKAKFWKTDNLMI